MVHVDTRPISTTSPSPHLSTMIPSRSFQSYVKARLNDPDTVRALSVIGSRLGKRVNAVTPEQIEILGDDAFADLEMQWYKDLPGFDASRIPSTKGPLPSIIAMDKLVAPVAEVLRKTPDIIDVQLVTVLTVLRMYSTPSDAIRPLFALMREKGLGVNVSTFMALLRSPFNIKDAAKVKLIQGLLGAGPLLLKIIQSAASDLQFVIPTINDILDNVPPMQSDELDAVVSLLREEEDLVTAIGDPSQLKDASTLIGSASLGQVHRVKLADGSGKSAVLKFCRPTALFAFIAEYIHLLTVGWKLCREVSRECLVRRDGGNPSEEEVDLLTQSSRRLMLNFGKSAYMEFDTAKEAAAMAYANINIAPLARPIHVPLSYAEGNTPISYLLMEMASSPNGKGIVTLQRLITTELDKTPIEVENVQRLRQVINHVMSTHVGYGLINKRSFVHGDLHGGNIILPADYMKYSFEDCPIWLIDFGNHGSIHSKLRCGMARFILTLNKAHSSLEWSRLVQRIMSTRVTDGYFRPTLDPEQAQETLKYFLMRTIVDPRERELRAEVITVLLSPYITSRAKRVQALTDNGFMLTPTLTDELLHGPNYSVQIEENARIHSNALRIMESTCDLTLDTYEITGMYKVNSPDNQVSAVLTHFLLHSPKSMDCFDTSTIFFGRSVQMLTNMCSQLHPIVPFDLNTFVPEQVRKFLKSNPSMAVRMAAQCLLD